MSWGERSCLAPCRCIDKCKIETCNVNCSEYKPNGLKPDSVSSKKSDRDSIISKILKGEKVPGVSGFMCSKNGCNKF